ncbi:MAG TPA: hypothetical protein VEA44_09795 [Caulobacter sp.]|nr:hypothetical protein [Caulobacter sp.]
MEITNLEFLLQAVAAASALGIAAAGIVDITKALWGGPSRLGFGHIEKGCAPIAAALDAALGPDRWRQVLYSHWVNGRALPEQKAIVRSLVRLGLNPETAETLAAAGRVDAPALRAVAAKLQTGEDPTEAEMTLLGRMDAAIEAQLDAAFDQADQQYRSVARLLAAVVAIALSLAGVAFVLKKTAPADLALAILIGALAVPIAPVAKDLSSALSSAISAFKAARGA